MITEKELLKILRKACKEAGSQRKWALDHKMSPAHVNDVLKGNRGPGDKILKALEYERVVGFVKKD